MALAVRRSCWVFTNHDLPVVPGAPITFTRGDVAAVHGEMVAAAGGRNVWIVGGGDLAGQFADAGLLDEVIVWIASVTLGAGAPLLPRRLELRVEEARAGTAMIFAVSMTFIDQTIVAIADPDPAERTRALLHRGAVDRSTATCSRSRRCSPSAAASPTSPATAGWS